MDDEKEVIKSIVDFWEEEYEGYRITTNKQVIEFKIYNQADCCEHWGHICSDDNFNEYIGTTIESIVLVDDKLTTWKLDIDGLDFGPDPCNDEKQIMFINVKTSCGTLQFALYNFHNGYYAHSVIIKSNQLNIEDYL